MADINSPNLTRQDFPHQTIDEAISMFSRDNPYRELEWLQREGEIDFLYETDSVVNKVLDIAQSNVVTHENPIIQWIEGSRLEVATTITAEVNSSATTLVLADNKLVAAGMHLFSHETGEWMTVTARTDDNVTVTRGSFGTTARTIPAGTALIAQTGKMAELDEPKMGVGILPGERQWQAVGVCGVRFAVSHMQQNSRVRGGWGQLPAVTIEQWQRARRQAGFDALFSPRYTGHIADRGQIYVGGGVTHFIKTNIFPLGSESSVHTYENYNDAMRNSFAPDASSGEKLMLAGPLLFRNLERTAREAGKKIGDNYWSQLFTDAFDVQVDGGVVHVVLAKHDLPEQGRYQLGDWGIGLDMKNVYAGQLKGFEWKVIPNVNTALGQITAREDAIVGSQSVVLKHESTHFLIKGAPDRNVKRIEIA